MIPDSTPIIIRKAGLKGVQSLARDRTRRAVKLKGGPGIAGRMHPINPMTARMSPKIIRVVVNIFSSKRKSEKIMQDGG